jgi:hypothetical protein
MNYSGSVVGSFTNNQQAREAVRALRQAGFTDAEIGFLARDGEDWKDVDRGDLTGTKMEEGAGIGAAAGAATGAGLGLAVMAGLIPPLGPAVAGGTLVAILASAGGGAAAGTLIGALVGMGIPEDEAAYYEGEIRSGRTIVSVRAGSRADEAETILRRHGADVRAPAVSVP